MLRVLCFVLPSIFEFRIFKLTTFFLINGLLFELFFYLLQELEKDKTTICSPLSAEIVLALTALGCKNQSHDELLKALGMTDDEAVSRKETPEFYSFPIPSSAVFFICLLHRFAHRSPSSRRT